MESIGAFLPLILIFGVFYILLIRPQQKKAKLHREMINNLRRGDKIITSGGGGMILTDNKKINEKVRYYINQSKDDSFNFIHNSTISN